MDQPLCTDCCAKVQKEVEAALRETEREIDAYQAALRRLSAGEETPLPDEELRRQLAAVEEEEDRERCSVVLLSLHDQEAHKVALSEVVEVLR